MADIAINPVSRRVQYTGNTGLGPFAFTFNILADADIAVYKNTTLLTLTSEYTVSTNADGTGSITLTGSGNGTALIASDVLTLIGARQLERTTDFVAGGDFFAASINEQLDSQVIMAQQLDEKLSRALKVNPGDEFTDLELPLKSARLGRTLQFNETTGDPEAGPLAADIASASTFAAAAEASATSAASDASSASSSASSAASSASAAAASESAAATSETNAAASASSASTSASSASTSASSASASATAASSAQTAAETARDQTLAAFDNFDDRYLGDKASDPTTDNDGDPLVGGALYFNTTVGELRVWTGTTWVAAYGSLTGALLVANNLSDVQDAATSRTNLGLGTGDSPTFSGLTVNGNIAVTGTVDGRDIATDGTKLDGIEAGANLGATTGKAIAMAIVFGG